MGIIEIIPIHILLLSTEREHSIFVNKQKTTPSGVAFYINTNPIHQPPILHQIRVDVQFRGGDGEDPSSKIAVGFEGPGIFPLAKADQVVSEIHLSPNWSVLSQSIVPFDQKLSLERL